MYADALAASYASPARHKPDHSAAPEQKARARLAGSAGWSNASSLERDTNQGERF